MRDNNNFIILSQNRFENIKGTNDVQRISSW